MGAFLDDLTTQMYNIIWALPLTILALGTGLYFSLRMKFPQIRLFKDMVHYLLGRDRKREDRTSKEGMSSLSRLLPLPLAAVSVSATSPA